MPQIFAFGDTIVYGAWDAEGGWVNRLRKVVDKKVLSHPSLYYLVYNLGVSGDTSQELLDRFERELEHRKDPEEESIFIFAVGINDSIFDQKLNSTVTISTKFADNIRRLHDLAKKHSGKIVFVGLTPVDEEKCLKMKVDKSYSNSNIMEYNKIIKTFCEENNIHFIDVFDKFMNLDYKTLLEDGLHPNSEGHELLFKQVKSYLVSSGIVNV
ncbi:hypothetical protein HYT52_02675 [Candidatus Woesearchaeota archaeon]|nr:hypothetical protein [Candidatus Woesearchaeota archaeon]